MSYSLKIDYYIYNEIENWYFFILFENEVSKKAFSGNLE